MKQLTLFFLLAISFGAKANLSDDIIGDWGYLSVVSTVDSQKEIKEAYESSFKGASFSFYNDGIANIDFGNFWVRQQWKLNNNIVELEGANGQKSSIRIVSLTPDNLIIDFENYQISFMKINDINEKITKSLSIKWYLLGIDSVDGTLIGGKMTANDYILLRENGTYEAKFNAVKEEGTWVYNHQQHTIETIKNGKTTVWDVLMRYGPHLRLIKNKEVYLYNQNSD